MPKAPEPFTLPTHSDLLERINDTSVAIKLHHHPKLKETRALEKAKANCKEPTWEEVDKLLLECRQVIAQIRYNPVKY